MIAAERTEEKVPGLLPRLQGRNCLGVEGLIYVIVESVARKAFLPPIMIAIRFIEIIALGDSDLFVTIDTRVLMAVMKHSMAARLENFAKLNDLLCERAGGIFPNRDCVGDPKDMKSVAHQCGPSFV